MASQDEKQPLTKQQRRDQRLAAELRANLKRRKAPRDANAAPSPAASETRDK